jgi:hypothetical protein
LVSEFNPEAANTKSQRSFACGVLKRFQSGLQMDKFPSWIASIRQPICVRQACDIIVGLGIDSHQKVFGTHGLVNYR